jgi:hypothetical protein
MAREPHRSAQNDASHGGESKRGACEHARRGSARALK